MEAQKKPTLSTTYVHNNMVLLLHFHFLPVHKFLPYDHFRQIESVTVSLFTRVQHQVFNIITR